MKQETYGELADHNKRALSQCEEAPFAAFQT